MNVERRCRLNVIGHLPGTERAWVRAKLRQGWANRDPVAAASLREGLSETLTVNRLAIDGALLKTVFSANPVESMIEIIRDHASNVKRWLDGEMTVRWAAAGTESAQSQFRRIKGYRQLPQLAAALEAATINEPELPELRATG